MLANPGGGTMGCPIFRKGRISALLPGPGVPHGEAAAGHRASNTTEDKSASFSDEKPREPNNPPQQPNHEYDHTQPQPVIPRRRHGRHDPARYARHLTLILSGNNSAATGGMAHSGGVTQFESPGSINGTTENVTINANGVLAFGSSFGAGNIPSALADRVIASSAGVIAMDNYDSMAFDFATPGLGSAYLGSVANLTYTGQHTPGSATYRLGGGGTLTLTNTSAMSGNLALDVRGNVVISGNIATGTGTLTKSNTGTLTLSGANTYSGTTTIGTTADAGTVILSGSNSSAGATSLSWGILQLNSASNGGLASGNVTFGNATAGRAVIQATGTDQSISNNLVLNQANATFSGNYSLQVNGTFGNGSNGTLIFQGAQAVPAGNLMQVGNYSSGSGTTYILDDNGGVNNGTINFTNTLYINCNNQNGQNQVPGYFVGNNNTANGGNSTGTTTGVTMMFATLNVDVGVAGNGNGNVINGYGANGYKLGFQQVNLPALTVAGNWTAQFKPTTAALVLGSVIQANGSTGVGNSLTMALDGTASGNLVTGTIKDALDYTSGSNPNASKLSLTKLSTSTWMLSGAGGAGDSTDRNSAIVSSSTLDTSGTGALMFNAPTGGTISPDVTGLGGTWTTTQKVITGLTSTANLAVGMRVSGTGIVRRPNDCVDRQRHPGDAQRQHHVRRFGRRRLRLRRPHADAHR